LYGLGQWIFSACRVSPAGAFRLRRPRHRHTDIRINGVGHKRRKTMRDSALESRFFAKVRKSSTSECWEWTGACRNRGYGAIKIAGRHEQAHRVAYLLYVGEIPAGMFVLHRCDNRKCVKPAHLFLGTHADNMRDMHQKGRNVPPRGAQQWASKLSPERVAAIRADGRPSFVIAREHGVHPSTVSRIRRGELWGTSGAIP
jgi:hypothetical protein